MRTLSRIGLMTIAAMIPLTLNSTTVAAQQQGGSCRASVMHMDILPGKAAAKVSVSMSRSIGPVTGFQAISASAPRLASPTALPKDDTTQKPIVMASMGNGLTLWLNTVGVKAGTYQFTLVGSQGECSGSMTIGTKG